MTVSNALNRKTYAGNGVTTSFDTAPVIFYVNSDITVQIVTDATGAATTLTENTHYTLSGGNGSTGTANLAAGSSPFGAPAAGTTLVILRTLAITQGTDFINNDANDAEVAERTIDRLTLIAEQLRETASRSLRFPSAEGLSGFLPTLANRAGKLLGFDSITGAVTVAAALSAVFSSAVVGQIPFGVAGGSFGQDSNIFWDNTNKRLGVGTSTPGTALDVTGDVRSGAHFILTGTTGGAGGATRYIGAGGGAHFFYNVATGASHLFGVNEVTTVQFTSAGITIAGSAVPQLLFSPTSGATKQAQIQQVADVLNINDLGGTNRLILNLGTGQVAVPGGVNTPSVGSESGTTALRANGTNAIQFSSASFNPQTDNGMNLGQANLRYSMLFTPIIDSGTTGALSLKTNNGKTQVDVIHQGDGTNVIRLLGGTTGASVFIAAAGETNTAIEYYTKGSGGHTFDTGATNDSGTGRLVQFQVLHTASATRNITVTGSNGSNPQFSTTGGDLFLTSNTGIVRVSSGSLAIGASGTAIQATGINMKYDEEIWSRNQAGSGDIVLVESETVNSVNNLIRLGRSSGGVFGLARSGAGAPGVADLPASNWMVFRDTSGATTKLYYNNAGTLQSVALA